METQNPLLAHVFNVSIAQRESGALCTALGRESDIAHENAHFADTPHSKFRAYCAFERANIRYNKAAHEDNKITRARRVADFYAKQVAATAKH